MDPFWIHLNSAAMPYISTLLNILSNIFFNIFFNILSVKIYGIAAESKWIPSGFIWKREGPGGGGVMVGW